VRVAVVGLGFGAEFVPIYQNHPLAAAAAVCRRDTGSLDQIADGFGVEKRYSDFDEVLADPDIDAVHLCTPIPLHAEQTVAALEAGKHVACNVPMATTIEECERIVDAVDRTGLTYMMMETRVYSREYLLLESLERSGALGRLQFLRGAHHQNMRTWPGYWEGLPPMHYATHAVSPLLALAQRPAAYVHCHGSGRIADDLVERYGSPYAVESALVGLHGSDLSAEVTRSLFDTAREYTEAFAAYGSLRSFEWEQTLNAGPILFDGEVVQRLDVPDFADLLPTTVRRFTTEGLYSDALTDPSFVQSSGHGGSHPHLVDRFLRSIVDGSRPMVDAPTAANWTCVGLCAHQSALTAGSRIDLPGFTLAQPVGALSADADR
jgi:predicted dehydrogenase